MSILVLCAEQVDKYNFKVWDRTTQEAYDAAGVDLSSVSSAKIVLKNMFDLSEYEVDILSRWSYLLGDGIIINVTDLPDSWSVSYFPDWMYEIKVKYTYGGKDYSYIRSIGFRSIITDKVIQQLQQSDWAVEFECGCEKYSTSFRKFDFLNMLEVASRNCLANQYVKILKALYRLSGERHGYDQ